jgi:hypothetical protein
MRHDLFVDAANDAGWALDGDDPTCFAGLNAVGSYPLTGLTLNSSGALFGTISAGGTAGKGTIFAVEP